MFPQIYILTAVVALTLSACAQQGLKSTPSEAMPIGKASGSVKLEDESYQVKDVVAYREEGKVMVALSDKVFDRQEFAMDGVLDSFDILGHAGRALSLKVDAMTPDYCLQIKTSQGGGTKCNSDIERAIKISLNDGKQIAGSMNLKGEQGDSIALNFDASIQDKLERVGEALPEDGGEPGEALLAHFAAIASGDVERIKAVAPPKKRAEIMATKPDELKEMIGFLQSMSPSNIKIKGGVVNGHSAILDYTGTNSGEKVTGTAVMTLVDGTWYVEKNSERHSDDPK